jgi:hypothetical protein
MMCRAVLIERCEHHLTAIAGDLITNQWNARHQRFATRRLEICHPQLAHAFSSTRKTDRTLPHEVEQRAAIGRKRL